MARAGIGAGARVKGAEIAREVCARFVAELGAEISPNATRAELEAIIMRRIAELHRLEAAGEPLGIDPERAIEKGLDLIAILEEWPP